MREIDVETWPRRRQFAEFKGFWNPRWDVCAPVDVTALARAVRDEGASFTAAVAYVLTRASNDITEFRCRIRGDTVVEHEMVHPGVTILVADGLFSFCHLDYCEDFTVFADRYAEGVAAVKEEPTMVTPGRDDLLFMSAIPWISFTSFSHPVPTLPPDSIPRFAWGKVFGEEGRLKMPLEADGHHALMDGIHMGRFYGLVQDYLDHPDFLLSAAG